MSLKGVGKLNKKEFKAVMKKELSGLPKEEREDILLEYEVHFSEETKKGKSEAAICKELGSPKELAKMYKVNVLIQEAEDNISTNNILRAVLASIGLGLFNLILVLGPFLGLLGLLAGIFAASLGLVFAGLVLFADALFGPFNASFIQMPYVLAVEPLFSGPLGVGIFAIGILIFILGIVFGRLIYRLSIKYLKFNLKMIKGK